MAALTSAVAQVTVIPNLKGFQNTVRRDINRMKVAPVRVHAQIVTDRLVSGMRQAMTRVTDLARQASASVATAFQKNFPRSADVIARFASGFRGATDEVSKLTDRVSRVGASTRRALDTAARPIQNFVSGFRDSSAAASAFTGRMGTIGGVARRAVTAAQGAFASLGSGVRNVGSRISETLRTGIQAPLGGISRMATGLVAAVGLGTLGTAAMQAATQIQNAQLTLTGLYGSAEAAGDMLERIKRVSSGSPIEYQAYANGAKQLAYMGIEGEQAEGILRNVGAAITAVGGDSTGMDRATTAMLGMINSGKVYAAQLNQLSDAGVPIWSALSHAMYGTVDRVADVRDAVTNGAVSIDQVMQAIEQGAGETFQKQIAASDEVSKSFSNQWKVAKDAFIVSMGEMLTPLLNSFAPAIGDFGRSASESLRSIPGALAGIGDTLERAGVMDALRSMRDMFVDLAKGSIPVFKGVLEGVGGVFSTVLLALKPLFDMLAGFGRYLQENEDVARRLGIALGILGGVLITAKVVTMGLSTATWILNAAMRANPIGLVITALMLLVGGIVYAWNNFDWFRDAVLAVWDFLKGVGSWIGSVFVAIWDGLSAAFRAVGDAFTWVWENLLRPVWNALKTTAEFVGTLIAVIVVGSLVKAWEFLGSAFRWVYDNVLRPMFDAFAAIAQWLWINILTPVFRAMQTGWDALATAFRWVYDNIVRPMFDAFAAVARWLWDNILTPVFSAIRRGWELLSESLTSIYRTYIAPIFDWFGDRVEQFRGYFDTLVGRIIGIWETMKEGFKEPINWVLRVVWNEGVGGLWDKASKILPLDPFEPAQLLATGGPVRGPGTGTSDSIPARLSNGEHVLTAKEVRLAGGHSAIQQWREGLRNGGSHPALHRANGGPVRWQDLWAEVRGQFPTARMTSAFRPGDSGYHGRGTAVDVAGPTPAPRGSAFMNNVNAWIAGKFPGSAELIYTPGINLKNGAPHNYSAGVAAQHYNHVHWANNGAAAGEGGGWFAGAWNWVLDRIRGIYDAVANPLRSLVDSTFPGDALVQKFPRLMTHKVLDVVRDKLFGDAGGMGDGVEGTGPVVDQVKQAAAAFGWHEGAQWNALSQLISNESSWNPTAQNPRSTAYGLFQFLNSTWGTVGATKTSNPGLQAQAGLRYIQQRYRDPLGAISFWNRNRWYDSGGWLKPGITGVMNRTGQPEAVLTNTQWQVASEAIRHVMRETENGVNAGKRDTGKTVTVNMENNFSEIVDVDQAINRAAFLSGNL